MVTQSPTLDALGGALAKAQAKMKGAVRDSANPFFKSKYADLASVWDACREALTAHGLSVVQSPSVEADLVTVTTMLLHESGQFVSGMVSARPSKSDVQGIGSAITYLRRYALAAMVGIAPEDDDGEAAVGRKANGHAHSRPEFDPRPAEMPPEPPAPPPPAKYLKSVEDQIQVMRNAVTLRMRTLQDHRHLSDIEAKSMVKEIALGVLKKEVPESLDDWAALNQQMLKLVQQIPLKATGQEG